MFEVKRSFTAFLVLLFLTVCLVPVKSYAKWVWNKETGWIDTPLADIATVEQRYKYALSLLVEQKYINAIKELESIVDAHPDTDYAEAAQIHIGWAYFLNGDYKRSVKAYNRYLQRFPGTKRASEILRRMYQVGISQMEVNERAAIPIFEKIIEIQPLGPMAPDAQIKIADCYFELGHYEEAQDAYEKFLENYPENEWVPYVQYRIPLTKFKHEMLQERNYGLLVSAREGFEEYLASNPHGMHAEDAKRFVKEIKSLEAKREFDIAEFYLRRHKPSSAAMYFEYVIQDFPNTVWAEMSRERLAFLRMIEAIK